MKWKITWLGHSAFLIEGNDKTILLDAFLTDNPLAAADPASLNPDLILLSHAHGDHLGDTLDIAKRTGAMVVANFEIGNWLQARGAKVHQQNPGGGYDHGIAHVKFTMAHHSSSFPDGGYGGEPNGFIITLPDTKRLYFAGDTSLFLDMQLIGEEGIDLAFLPIGDNFTMGPADSLKAIRMLKPRLVIPMHYNTWDAIAQDASAWANRVSSETDAQPIVLDPGGSYTFE
jgi:L-ascorbate metabolism protein UlaG (beta-lactamase superfamily)